MQTQEAPRKTGQSCWFYGCISLALLLLLSAIAGFFLLRLGLNQLKKMAEQYAASEPLKLERVELTPDEMTNLVERVHSFQEALESQQSQEELVLTSDEINALIGQNPELSDKLLVKIEDDRITGQISLPLDEFGFKDKYLNGSGTFEVSLSNRRLHVYLHQVEVNGQPLPAIFDKEIKKQDLARNVQDPELEKAISKFETIEVKDGRIICRNRVASPQM